MTILSRLCENAAAIGGALLLATLLGVGSLGFVSSPAMAGDPDNGQRWSEEQWRQDERRGSRNIPFVGYGHQRTQSGDLVPAPGSPEPRYPHGATQTWIPGHFVGGYYLNGRWLHRRWVPGRMVVTSELE